MDREKWDEIKVWNSALYKDAVQPSVNFFEPIKILILPEEALIVSNRLPENSSPEVSNSLR